MAMRIHSGGYLLHADLLRHIETRIASLSNDLSRVLLAERESDTIRGRIAELKQLRKSITEGATNDES